ncbi:MAG: IS200/IS605 family transposase [Muribaculaceae bacterium]|nr:IS200/IS605 family transposase [Muribaculaceae bacterium]
MSTTKSLYHIVINTKSREKTIPEENKRELYAYLFGIIKNKHCTLLRMNGIENHIHMLVDLAPDIALSDFMRELKRSSSLWIKSHHELFPRFVGWGREYYAFSCGVAQKDAIVEYIKEQEIHHKTVSFDDEMKCISEANACDYYVYD